MLTLLWMIPASGMPAEPPLPTEKTWSIRAEFQTGAERANPTVDRDAQATWHFLRTSRFSGPVETRQWLRDGKYVALSEQGANLFDSPLDGWAYRSGDLRQAPLIGSVTADYDVGLKFKQGELLIAPGPEHAAVIAWESPVTGTLNIAGVFEHAQNCCGDNSQINWYVELGPAPDAIHGFQSVLLAHGSSDFGSPNQVGEFHIVDQAIRPGEFVYFIVDAVADGTSTPHHGDATRFDVTFTIGAHQKCQVFLTEESSEVHGCRPSIGDDMQSLKTSNGSGTHQTGQVSLIEKFGEVHGWKSNVPSLLPLEEHFEAVQVRSRGDCCSFGDGGPMQGDQLGRFAIPQLLTQDGSS